MSMYTEQQAKAILDKVLAYSKADECTATLTGGLDGNIRFALNNVSTSGIVSDADLAVQVAFGKRVGLATINSFDDESLRNVVLRAEELARLAPENEEFVPAIGKQNYMASNTFAATTADIIPEQRAKIAASSIAQCKAENLIAAGFMIDGAGFIAFANSNGNFGYQRTTDVNYTCTVRTEDGTGSGWVGRNVEDINKFDADEAIQVAISKAMMNGFDARQADEGRSFLSKKGGGNRMGEQVFDPRVIVTADPWDEQAPVLPWDGEGLPREKMTIIDKGKVNWLEYSRFWAQKQGKVAKGSPGNILMAGGTKSTMDLVKSTERGILVTRTWYIRMVDPQTVLLTGLTRDGTFYIENGEIKYPIKNFRFNESPVIMLNNVEEFGKPVRIAGDETNFSMMIPPMKLRDFTFTSLSDAV